MDNRPLHVFDEFSKHLRFLQFTLVVACIGFLTIILSDRETTISLANKQINDIYNYTLKINWNKEGIQNYLNSSAQKQSLLPGTLNFVHNENKTYLLTINQKNAHYIEFDFIYRSRYFKELDRADEIDFDGYVRRPNTLGEFKKFYDEMTTPFGVFTVRGLKNSWIQHLSGYSHNNPVGGNDYKESIPLEKVSISPKLDVKTSAVDKNYQASMEDGTLVIKWEDGYSDNMGNVNEEYSHYTIPFVYQVDKYKPVEYLSKCSTFDIANTWLYNSFDEQFKALHQVTKDWSDISIEAAKKIINSEYARAGDSFKIVGIELPSEMILSWGIFVIFGLQLYFYLHFSEFLGRRALFSEIPTKTALPWLILYQGKLPVLVFYATIVLLPPMSALAVTYINASIYPLTEFYMYSHVVVCNLAIFFVAYLLSREHHRMGSFIANINR